MNDDKPRDPTPDAPRPDDLTQPLHHAEAVEPRHHHVEHQQVRPERPGRLDGLEPSGGGRDLEAGEAQ